MDGIVNYVLLRHSYRSSEGTPNTDLPFLWQFEQIVLIYYYDLNSLDLRTSGSVTATLFPGIAINLGQTVLIIVTRKE